MKKQTVLVISLILILVLSACSSKTMASTDVIENLDYLPEHAPETSPFVRTEPVPENYGLRTSNSFERPKEGCFTFYNLWEYEMFKGMEPSDGLQHPHYVSPYEQDTPYNFVIKQTEMTSLKSEALEIAETFSQEGMKSRVKSYTSIENGKENTAYIAVITMTPNELWALSQTIEDNFLVEQLYPSVDLRFNEIVWEG